MQKSLFALVRVVLLKVFQTVSHTHTHNAQLAQLGKYVLFLAVWHFLKNFAMAVIRAYLRI